MTWPMIPLGKVATLERVGVQPEAIAAGTVYVGLENIEPGGDFVNVKAVEPGELASSKFAFTERHLLYGKLRPYLRKIARPAFAGICSTDILPIAAGPQLDKNYLHHFLLLKSSVQFASARATGVNLPRISPSILETLPVPLPTLEEQRRIAAILDQAEALRAKRRQALAKLDTLAQSLFLEMFCNPVKAKFPMEFVGDAIDPSPNSIRTGPFGSQLLHSEFVETGIPVLGIDNAVTNRFIWAEPRFISQIKYESLRRYTVRPGDVIVTIMGTCGRAAVIPDDIPTAINTKHLCCITVNKRKYLPEFLHSCILMHPTSTRHLLQTSKGAIMSGLNMDLIRSTPIPRPSLELQSAYRDRMNEVEAIREGGTEAGRLLDLEFNSLQHQAFRGEL